jgi:hypothetical protein
MGGHDETYMNYTEGHDDHGSSVGGGKIDTETGIAPRRCTDCVCLPIFFVYMLVMVGVIFHGRIHGQTNRLTHGFDYNGRLCGVTPEVALKPLLFWCRSDENATVNSAAPAELNLWLPSCVAKCPVNNLAEKVTCLMPQQVTVVSGAPNTAGNQVTAGAFGIVQSWFLKYEQTEALTVPYPTTAFGGRYCLPNDKNLAYSILKPTGPLNPFIRLVDSFGSFQDCWLAVFIAVTFAVILGFFYTFLMAKVGKYVLYVTLGVASAIYFCAGLYFLTAILTKFGWMTSYPDTQPLYQHNPDTEAFCYSIILGVFLILLSIGAGVQLKGVEEAHSEIEEMIDVTDECVFSMRELLAPPVLDAIWKFLLLWFLCTQFMYLVSVGYIDDSRIVVNGIRKQGATKSYYFDTQMIPFIVFYVYGAVWLYELSIAMLQFIVAYAVVLWYYVPHEQGGEKEELPKHPAIFGAMVAVRYHLGSLIFAAAIMPWLRAVRIFDEFMFGNLPNCLRSCLDCAQSGPFLLYNKNVYNDIVIRSNHLQPSALRTKAVIESHSVVKLYIEQGSGSKLRIITQCGVGSIGTICSLFTYHLCTTLPTFSDPLGGWYVQDPLMISFLALCLCGSIAYSFTMLIEHAGDVLLYTYAWNKKFKKASCGKFMPDGLSNVVGFQHLEADSYPLYGKADPNMYLGTWISTKKGGSKEKEKSKASQVSEMPPYASMQPGSTGIPPGGNPYGSNPYASGH